MPDETPSNGLPKNLALSELGQTGLRRFSGYVLDEYDPAISGMRWRTVAKEMLFDPVVAAMFFAVEMLVRQVKWTLDPSDSDGTGDAHPIKEFVEQCLFEDMNQGWTDTVAQILSFVPWGFSWFEVVFKERNGQQPSTPFVPNNSTGASQGIDQPQEVASSKFNDGKIGFRKWAIRSQDTVLRWEFDENGGIRALVQLSPPHYKITTIPIEKSLLFRLSTQKNDPEGQRGMLRKVYRAWSFKRNLENLEGIGIERDAAGIPFGRIPSEYMASDAPAELKAIYTAMQKIVTGIKNDEQAGLILPSDRDEKGEFIFDLTLLSAAGTKQFDIGKSIERWDQRILMTLLGDFLKMGHERVGSFAMAEAKIDLFQTAIGAFLGSVADIVNRHAIPKLLRINNIPEDQAPKLEHSDIAAIDLEEVGTFIKNTTGVSVDLKSVLGYLLQKAGVPIPDDEAVPKLEKKADPVLPPNGNQPPGITKPVDPKSASELVHGAVPDEEDRRMMRRSWIKNTNGKAKGLYLK
jgi:hypothetical protein